MRGESGQLETKLIKNGYNGICYRQPLSNFMWGESGQFARFSPSLETELIEDGQNGICYRAALIEVGFVRESI